MDERRKEKEREYGKILLIASAVYNVEYKKAYTQEIYLEEWKEWSGLEREQLEELIEICRQLDPERMIEEIRKTYRSSHACSTEDGCKFSYSLGYAEGVAKQEMEHAITELKEWHVERVDFKRRFNTNGKGDDILIEELYRKLIISRLRQIRECYEKCSYPMDVILQIAHLPGCGEEQFDMLVEKAKSSFAWEELI